MMKFTIKLGFLTLVASLLSTVAVNAQTGEPIQQPTLPIPVKAPPNCVAINSSEKPAVTSQQPTTRSLSQEQQNSECALNPKPKPTQVEKTPTLSERDRLILERSQQRIIPSQN